MEIRKVTQSDDFDAISRIYALSWKAAYKGIVPQKFLDELSETRWAAFLRDSVSYVIIDNGEYVGTSSICAARDENMAGWGEIISIYLLPECFGKGFGKPLLDAALSGLAEMGFDKIYLWVLEENARGRAFYEKHGFASSPDRMITNIGGRDLVEMRYVYRA